MPPRVKLSPSAVVDEAPAPSLGVAKDSSRAKAPTPTESFKSSAPATTGDTVVVACKFPIGIVLQLYKDGEVPIGQRGEVGQKLVKGKVPHGNPFKVNGPRYHIGGSPHCEIIGGWALTRGVPRDLWRQWVQDNSQLQLVVEGLIQGFDTIEEARTECRRNRDVKTGMEPLTPDDDPRVKSLTNKGIKLEKGEDRDHEFVEDRAYDS